MESLGTHIHALTESINNGGERKNQWRPATYFNLLMKVTLLQQCQGAYGFYGPTHVTGPRTVREPPRDGDGSSDTNGF